MEPKPDITPATLVTSAITLVVILIAVAVILLMPSGLGTISDMEYAVWEAVIGSASEFERRIVQPDTICVVEGRIGPFDLDEVVDACLESDDLDPHLVVPIREAVADFRRKGKAKSVVENRFSPEVRAELLSLADRNAILVGRRLDLEEFRRRYGCLELRPELVALSRVGFSRDGRIALVYWSRSLASTSGSGGFGFLRWTGEGWERAVMLVTWVS